KHVHVRALETVNRLLRLTNNRLIVIERRVQDDGNAGQISKFANQPPIAGVGGTADGLQPAGAVNVRGRGDRIALFRTDGISKGHEWRWLAALEILSNRFFQNGRRERTEHFAVLDARVESLFHFRAARVHDDTAISQRARTPFGPSL